MGFFSSPESYLGIDIGSTNIKIVELQKDGKQAKLLTYGFSENITTIRSDWQSDSVYAAKIINKICNQAHIKSKNAIAALPTFSVFTSIINLTNVDTKNLAAAVSWEAKKVIPLPLEEMILDWKIIKEPVKTPSNNVKVLLTGAPQVLVKKYIDIFKAAQINLLSLETETFSLIRSLLGNNTSTMMIVELGANTTDISIVDNSLPVLNRSIDVGGDTITKAIANHLGIGIERAEQFKYDLGVGLIDSQEDIVPKIIIETISPILNEIKYAINLYQNKSNKKTEKIILSGGSSLLPNLVNYISQTLNINVIIGDPWARIAYPEDLRPLLHEIGPSMSVAIGLAMREIE